ncbi:MAG: hypothetical protein AAF394_06265, partial [Planctomycetota bacterium]
MRLRNVQNQLRHCLLALAALLCMVANVQAKETHVFHAGAIWTGTGEPIQDAVLVVEDGKVVKVGAASETVTPDAAIHHDLGDVTLVPGLVIPQTGLVGSSSSDPYSISPEVRAVDGFDPFDDYEALLEAGITCVEVAPVGRKLIAGQSGVVRLGADAGEHVALASNGLLINLNRTEFQPSSIYEPPVGAVSVDRPLEPTQPQLATSLSQAR